MGYRYGPMSVIRDRFQYGSYGFIAGLVIGLLLGWVFSGVVGFIVRFGVVIVLLAPLVIIFLVWRKLTERRPSGNYVDVDAIVVDTRSGRERW
jgi:hypothetical protein